MHKFFSALFILATLSSQAMAAEKLHVDIELRDGVASYKKVGESELDFAKTADGAIEIHLSKTFWKIIFKVNANLNQPEHYEISPELYDNDKRIEKDITTKFTANSNTPYRFTWGRWLKGQFIQFRLTFNR